MLRRRAALGSLLALMLLGCTGPAGSGSDQQTSEPREQATSGSAQDSQPDADEEKAARTAKLVKTGFGQRGQYAWVTSLVKNQSEDNIGRFVTVQFNLLDKKGEIIGSTDQVESFSRADQDLVLGTQVDIADRQKVVKVEATLEVGNLGDDDPQPFPEIKTGKVKVSKGEYGDTVARFEVFNPTDKSLENPRIGVICYDSKDRIIGGASAYPQLVPPSGKRLEEVSPITSGKIDRCMAYAGPGY